MVVTCATARAHGGFYEFRLRGEVIAASYPNVSVGDQFTIRYVADSQDLDPHPAQGRYVATPLSVTFPNALLRRFVPGTIYTAVDNANGTDTVWHWSFFPQDILSVDLTFPAGTLGSDALPLAVPLTQATTSRFELYLFGPALVGEIHSYQSVEIPEPRALAWAVLAGSLPARRRARTRSGGDAGAVARVRAR
jgi:hypothetical protein